jgi:hypothetical protein
MDFRVTHFLSGATVTANNAQVIGAATPQTSISIVETDGTSVGTASNIESGSSNVVDATTIQIWRGLDITDPIQKELRFIKSGKIKKSNIVSLRKLAGTSTKNEMVKFLGPKLDPADVTLTNYKATTDVTGSVLAWGNANQGGLLEAATGMDSIYADTCSSLNFACGQEFSLTVRAQSARANTISPFGLTKTYTRMVNCCDDCGDSFFRSAYTTASQVMTDLANDPVMSDYVKPTYIFGWYLTTNGAKAYFKVTYGTAFSAATTTSTYVPGTEEVIGEDFVIGIVLEGVEQPMWENNADITLFPFRKDAVKIFAQTFVGPMAASNPHNSGTQEPLLVADMCDKGQTYTINFNFPELTGTEVKHIEHEYATYSQKYGQRFQGVKYNALVLPSLVDTTATYTLFYIEYAPIVDVSYTSTMNMTQLTIVALPTGTEADRFENTIEKWAGIDFQDITSGGANPIG